jgi:hypothetical protein
MRRYLTLIVVPFVLSAVLAAQPPTTPPGNKPETPGKPQTPPGQVKAAEAPNPKGKPPEPKQIVVTPTTAPPPTPVTTAPGPADIPNVVKPGDCPAGQTCEPLTTPDTPSPIPWSPPMPPMMAQPTQYAQRYALSADTWFVGRVTLAAMFVSGEVMAEAPTTANHEARMKFVGQFIRNPDEGGRRLARFVVVYVPIAVDKAGLISTPATDAQIVAVLRQRWTMLSQSMSQLF